MADHVEIDYDQMAHIAQACDQQGQEAEQMLRAVRSQVENLRAGGWVGQGADAFFGEMDDLILPALNRLVAALQQAADTVRAVAYQFGEAEQDTFNLFRSGVDGLAGGMKIGGGSPISPNFPDVFKVPFGPASPQPIPYPNVGPQVDKFNPANVQPFDPAAPGINKFPTGPASPTPMPFPNVGPQGNQFNPNPGQADKFIGPEDDLDDPSHKV